MRESGYRDYERKCDQTRYERNIGRKREKERNIFALTKKSGVSSSYVR